MKESELLEHVKKLYEKYDTDFLPSRILIEELKGLGLSEKEAESVLYNPILKDVIPCWGLFEGSNEKGFELVNKEEKKTEYGSALERTQEEIEAEDRKTFEYIVSIYEKCDKETLPKDTLIEELKKLKISVNEVEDILKKAEAKDILEPCTIGLLNGKGNGVLAYILVTQEYRAQREWVHKKMKQRKL